MTTAFITDLLSDSRSDFDRMVSIVVYAHNEEIDYIPLLVEFVVRGEIRYSDDMYNFWNEVGEGEDWSYCGRDEHGEKQYHLWNEGCEESRYNKLLHEARKAA